MDKIKKWFNSMSLRKAFVSIVLVMALLVAGFSAVVIYSCTTIRQKLLDSVTITMPKQIVQEPKADEDAIESEHDIVIVDDGQFTLGENGSLIVLTTEYRIQNLPRQHRIFYYLAGVATIAVPCLLFVAGTFFCAWLFYYIKMKRPLALLLLSADSISQNELDFVLDYPSADEMGQLCHAMDAMRSALQKNNQEMWNMMEERRKLTASIAHDLRTPITVMKGYTEYLAHNIHLGRISQDKVLETVNNLSQATQRLEQYVNQVREVQMLDAVPIKAELCQLSEFFEEHIEEYAMLIKWHNLQLLTDISNLPNIFVQIDQTLVCRMMENVISNSIRYAKQQIAIVAVWSDDILRICVQDDGPGFSDTAIQSAVQSFYKENSKNDHFGLGLSICDTLCRRLGGSLSLKNVDAGGACVEINICVKKS